VTIIVREIQALKTIGSGVGQCGNNELIDEIFCILGTKCGILGGFEIEN